MTRAHLAGLIAAVALTLTAGATDARAEDGGQHWAVVAGIGAYQASDIPATPNAVNDAARVRDWFVTAGGLAREQVLLLTDGGDAVLDPTRTPKRVAPTRANLRVAVRRWLKRNVSRGDTVFFYFAGQATRTAKGAPLLLPIDANPADLADTSIDAAWVSKQLATLPAAGVMLWYDTSFAGRGTRWGPATPVALTGLKPGGKGALWLAAGPDAPAAEAERAHQGRFTQALLATLRTHSASANDAWKQLGSALADAPSPPTRIGALPRTVTLARARGGSGGAKPALLLQDGHADRVFDAAYAPDGNAIATASQDNTAKIWDPETGRVLATLIGHTKRVRAVAWHPDAQTLATAAEDKSVRLWNGFSGINKRVLRGHSAAIRALAWRSDGGLLASGGADKRVVLWPSDASVRKRVVAVGRKVMALAFSRDGRALIVGGEDGYIAVHDVATGRRTALWRAHRGPINALELAPDGRTVFTGGDDNVARGWDLATKTQRFETRLADDVLALAVHPDGQEIAVGHGKVLQRLVAADGTAHGSPIERLVTIRALDYRGDGAEILAGAGKYTHIWPLGAAKARLILAGRSVALTNVATSGDGRTLITGSRDGVVTWWDLTAGKVRRPLEGQIRWGQTLAVDAGGTLVVAAGSGHKAQIFGLDTGEVRHQLVGHTGAVTAVAVRADGKRAATASKDGTARLWNADTGAEVSRFEGDSSPLIAVDLSRDGATLATVTRGGKARLFATSEPTASPLQLGVSLVTTVAIHPRGGMAATGHRNGKIRLWTLPAGRPRGTLEGHEGWINVLRFSGSGQLASGGEDGTARVWDVRSKAQVTFEGHVRPVTGVAFAGQQGDKLVTSSLDASLRVWSVSDAAHVLTGVELDQGREWGVSTPEGHFDGTAGAQSQMEWRIGDRLYALSQFYNDFYTPGLMASVMAGIALPIPHALENVKPPPEVQIVSPAPQTRTLKGTVEVVVQATDTGGGVSRVWLYHNGHRLATTRNVARVAAGPTRFKVDLVEGENHLRATAFNADGSVEARGAQAWVNYDVPAAEKPVLHVVAVGIDRYRTGMRLAFAKKDAESVASFFGPGLFGAVKTHLLTDALATAKEIRAVLKRVADSAAPRDVVLLYLAGHGALVGQVFYFLPHDVAIDSDKALERTAISGTELAELMSAIPATKQVLMLDACHSGAATGALGKLLARRDALGMVRAQQRLARSTGSFLIAASTAEQYAKELPELGHGVLTYAALSGLGAFGAAKAAVDATGHVTVNSLIHYLGNEVPALTERFHGGRQDIVQESTGQDFPLVTTK